MQMQEKRLTRLDSLQQILMTTFSTLLKYHKSFENLDFITGDNCSVNKLLVKGNTEWYRTNKNIDRVLPLMGCASRKMNLAVQRLWKKETDRITISLKPSMRCMDRCDR